MTNLKQKIIQRLIQQPIHVSGQSLAEEFGVSRNAIWKAIQELKDNGYQIDS
uniref:HTH domain-containing protein n=1 Tax=Ignavigranum ruoffiae TaxID=89093 RepID=UPI003D15820C